MNLLATNSLPHALPLQNNYSWGEGGTQANTGAIQLGGGRHSGKHGGNTVGGREALRQTRGQYSWGEGGICVQYLKLTSGCHMTFDQSNFSVVSHDF